MKWQFVLYCFPITQSIEWIYVHYVGCVFFLIAFSILYSVFLFSLLRIVGAPNRFSLDICAFSQFFVSIHGICAEYNKVTVRFFLAKHIAENEVTIGEWNKRGTENDIGDVGREEDDVKRLKMNSKLKLITKYAIQSCAIYSLHFTASEWRTVWESDRNRERVVEKCNEHIYTHAHRTPMR